MPTIENCSIHDIQLQNYKNPGSGSVLIQIRDPSRAHPWPAANPQHFSEVHRFEFADVESATEPGAVVASQARSIAQVLQDALASERNVVVHCYAGICRSGAVVECATMLGFEAVHNDRIPNTLVKNLLLEALGLRITPKTSAFAQDFFNREAD